MTFVQVWVGYAIIGTLVVCVLFFWAIRTKQFTELDRQRYMALRAAEPIETETKAGTPSRIDRLTVPALLGLTLLTLAVVMFIGARAG